MFLQVDNFLPPELFSMFVTDSQRFSQGLTSGGRSNPTSVKSAEDIKNKLGIKWFAHFKQLQSLFDVEIIPESCRRQATNGASADWHWDAALPLGDPNADITKSYTSLLYTSPDWVVQEDESGAWQSRDGLTIQPMPNRLIIYSRDIEHRVKSGTWSGIRSLALLSFYEHMG